MLYFKKEAMERLIEKAKQGYPLEVCGILAGKSMRVEKIFPLKNIEESPYSYFVDAREQIKVMKQIREENLEMIGIYHSHPFTDSYPSRRDVELAYYPDCFYVIVSLKDIGKLQVRAFKIVEGKIREEEIEVI